MLGRPGGLRADQFNVESDRNPARHLVLKCEQIIGTVIEALGP